MEKIESADEIQKILKKEDPKWQNCFGLSKFNNKIYFAINGAPERQSRKVVKEIKEILGNDAIRCSANDSFTIFPSIQTYNNTFNNEFRLFLDLIPDNRYFWLPKISQKGILDYNKWLLDIGYSPRMFSCVERKILKKIGFSNACIHVSSQPCYLCLYAMHKVSYIRNKKIIYIERVTSNLFIDKFIKKVYG